MSIHQLKITPTDDERGFWLTSNGRTWFCDRAMLADINQATGAILDLKVRGEWRNYDEPRSAPMPFISPRSNSLEDLL